MFESFSEIEDTKQVEKEVRKEESKEVIEVEEDGKKEVRKEVKKEEVKKVTSVENVVSAQAVIVVAVYALALLCVLMYNDVTSPMVTIIALFVIVGASLMLDAQMATITTAITAIAAVVLFHITPTKPSLA